LTAGRFGKTEVSIQRGTTQARAKFAILGISERRFLWVPTLQTVIAHL
jgi:hypothetical protein